MKYAALVRFFLLIVCGAVTITACRKKEGINQNLDPNKQTETNYMSTKSGSWWLFGARNGDITKRMATGKDTVKNGLKFDYFELLDTNKKFITPEYFGKNENKYVSLYDLDGAQTNYVTLVFLLDSVKTGSSWENTQNYKYSSYNINMLVQSRVDFIDGTLALGDTVYNKVTKVHHDLKGKLPPLVPAYIGVGTLDVWFAQGIGIIKQDVNVDINVLGSSLLTKKHTDSLLDYHIEP